MKGIPAPCIKYYAQKKGITVLDVYKESFGNQSIKLNLSNDGNKFVCRHNKGHTVSNVTGFTRKCQYIKDESDKFFTD